MAEVTPCVCLALLLLMAATAKKGPLQSARCSVEDLRKQISNLSFDTFFKIQLFLMHHSLTDVRKRTQSYN